MSAEEGQEPFEDGGAGGPGAPTPLSTLEVDAGTLQFYKCSTYLNSDLFYRELQASRLVISNSLWMVVSIPSNQWHIRKNQRTNSSQSI